MCYKCRCSAWRWCDRAEELGESSCKECGTSFEHAAVEFWGTGAPARSREQSYNQVQNRKGRAAATAGKGGPKGASPGGKGNFGKGPQSGPKTPGRQDPLQKGSGKGAAVEPKPGNVVSYNKNKFKSDPVYAAQSWLEMAKTIHGEDSKEATEAAQKVDAAIRAVDERRTPAQKATRLREDRTNYIEAIAKGVQRIQHLQQQQEEISAELEKLDGEHRLALERLTTLDEQIATYELAAGLHDPLQPGGQVSQEPAERAQTRIQDIFKPLQKELEAKFDGELNEISRKHENAVNQKEEEIEQLDQNLNTLEQFKDTE